MPVTIAALTAEINADPSSLGYAAAVAQGSDKGVSDLLNLVRAGNPYKVNAGLVPAYQVINALVPGELATRTESQLNQLSLLTGAGQVDTSNANVQAQFLAIFDNATAPTTRAALIALAKRQGSRAEVLGGPGTSVTVPDVSRALGRI